MELGLFVEPQMGGSYRKLVELAQWAEAQGLAAFARSDHYLAGDRSYPATDALVSYGGLAVETDTIRLVTLVSPITFRHPGVMAKSASTIDEISGGRFTLGVGTGWMESEHDTFGLVLPPMAERFERLGEALAFIRASLSGGGEVNGTHYRLKGTEILPEASDGFRIVVGGGGPRKTPTLAGTYADEYNMFVTDADTLAARLSVMRSAATAAGRDPESILVSFAGPGLIYGSEAEHRTALTERGARRDLGPDEYAAFLDERLVPHGTKDRAMDAVSRLEALGVGRYYVQEFAALEDIDLDQMAVVMDGLGA